MLVVRNVITERRHSRWFFLELQFGGWDHPFRQITCTVQEPGKEEYDQKATNVVQVCKVEKVARKYTSVPGNYTANVGHVSQFHINARETALHFWTLGFHNQGMICRVKYEAVGCAHGEHPGRCFETSNLGRLPREDNNFLECRNSRLRADNKSVLILPNIARWFRRDGYMVMDSYTGTLSTSKACLMLRCRGQFVC